MGSIHCTVTKPCNPYWGFLSETTAEGSGPKAGRSRREGLQREGRDHESGAGLRKGGGGGCLCWKIKLRHGVERPPPTPAWEGGPLDPREALKILNTWDPQNQVMGSRRDFWKEGDHLLARGRGGTSDSLERSGKAFESWEKQCQSRGAGHLSSPKGNKAKVVENPWSWL